MTINQRTGCFVSNHEQIQGPTEGPITRPPLKDKDGTYRWDYWVKLELWEDDEYVVTLGGQPFGPTVGYREGKQIVHWLIHTQLCRIIAANFFDLSYHKDIR